MKRKVFWHKKVYVDMTCCDVCRIGAGVTKYPDGDFEHTQKVLKPKKYGKITYELCDSCYDMSVKHKTYLKYIQYFDFDEETGEKKPLRRPRRKKLGSRSFRFYGQKRR